MKRRFYFFVALCAIVALGLYLALDLSDTSRGHGAPSTSEAVRAPASNQGIPTNGDQRSQLAVNDIWGSGDASRFANTRIGYEKQSDLAAFFEVALRHPENGGIYYARKAYLDCATLKSTPASKTVNKDAEATFQRAVKRCDWLGDAGSRQRLYGLLDTAVKNADPIMNVAQDVTGRLTDRSNQPEIVEEALKRAIEIGDPYLFADAMFRLVTISEKFDGKSLDFDLRQDLHYASTVAYCDLGADCSNAASIPIVCKGTGVCPDSIVTMVLRSPQIKDDEQRKRIVGLADRLVSSARDGTLPTLFQGRAKS